MSAIVAKYLQETNRRLADIATAIGYGSDLTTWQGVQQAVRSGIAERVFPVGTNFTVAKSDSEAIIFTVVDHDFYKTADESAHTMTLLSRDLPLYGVQASAQQAFYYAETYLLAGTYKFNVTGYHPEISTGVHSFTTTKDVPVGGRIAFDGYGVKTYKNSDTYSVIETVMLTSDDSGTDLGEINDMDRVLGGSNNYKESAIRQLLNSSNQSGYVWYSKTKYDLSPTWKTTQSGFLAGLDTEFLEIVSPVVVPCIGGSYESDDSSVKPNSNYEVIDKFFIPSAEEVGLKGNNGAFKFFKNADDVDRKKNPTFSSSSMEWVLRTPGYLPCDIVSVSNCGKESLAKASDDLNWAIVCNIA